MGHYIHLNFPALRSLEWEGVFVIAWLAVTCKVARFGHIRVRESLSLQPPIGDNRDFSLDSVLLMDSRLLSRGICSLNLSVSTSPSLFGLEAGVNLRSALGILGRLFRS